MAGRTRGWGALGRALTAAVVLVGGLQLVPVAASAAPLAGSLSASVDPPVVKEQVVLSGSLPPVQARPVVLQRRTGTGAWTNATSTTSRADGSFSFSATMPSAVNSVVRFRVLANQVVLGGTTHPAVQTPDVVLRTVGQTASLTGPASVTVGSTYTLVADFGPDRPGRPVVLERRSGTTWVAVARTTQNATGGANFLLPAGSTPTTVTYRVLSKKWNGAPQVVSATRAVTVAVATDTTPPPVPGGVTAVPGDASAHVSWSAVAAADLAGYRVYRGPSATGPWTQVAETTAASHTELGLTNGTAVWFAVASVDATGNESTKSAAAQTVPQDITAPAVPTDLVATAGDGSVSLAWTAVEDAASYRVRVGSSSTGPWTAAGSPTTAGLVVPGLTNGTASWFDVAAVDAAGNVSDPSAPVSATPADSTPPPPVTLLSATPSDRQVTLSWTTSAEATSYLIERAGSQGGPYTTAVQSVSASPYTLTQLQNGTGLWFRVSARDAAGNLSEPSEALAATPVDDVAPMVPYLPTTRAYDRGIELTWGGEFGGDTAGFNVWVSGSETGPWTAVDGNPYPGGPADITGLTNGTTYWFSVSALDQSGNESVRSVAVAGTPFDNRPPPAPTDVTATAAPGKVTVSWQPVTDDGLVDYIVSRATSADATPQRIEWVTSTATTFEDADVVPGQTYWYVVQAVDAASNWSSPSATAQVVAADATPPAVPTGLVATAGDREVTVTWDAVTDADLAGYQVHRAPSAAGPWTAVGAAVSATTITVTGLPNGATVWFSVSAADVPGNVSARSAAVAAEPRRPAAAPATLAASVSHSCEVRATGSLWCWGNDGITLRLVPGRIGTASDWATVDAGNSVTCAIRTDGTLWCWGVNSYGRVGTGDAEWERVLSPSQVGSAADWTGVSVGENHACGTRSSGTLWCWGANDAGQVGDGTTTARFTPTQVGALTTWSAVSAGAALTCATRTDGTAWCWGVNTRGQVGDGTTTARLSPAQVGTATSWSTISAGGGHACATRTDDTAWCWGSNLFGQLGNGTASAAASSGPEQVGTEAGWTGVSAGSTFSCGTRQDATVRCWGRGDAGQLGSGSGGATTPTTVSGTWSALAVGWDHSCGRRTDGALLCWGQNRQGQLGNGHGPYELTEQVVPGAGWTTPTAGYSSTCALRADATLWCWGLLQTGTLSAAPQQALPGSTWTTVSAGRLHVCAIRTGGTMWCWGNNESGQLGDGTTTRRTAPVQVGSGTDWATVSAGGSHTCGTRSDGTAWCWGGNYDGAVGDGSTTTTRTTPVQVGASTGWASVRSGGGHTCGVRVDGSLWCWGANSYGALGAGALGTPSRQPVQVGTATSWAGVTAGALHTCATRTDGTLWCWGAGFSGQTASGTTAAQPVPAQVGSSTGWSTVAAGTNHTCATRTDGTLWCWGANGDGRLGDGTTVDSRLHPVQVGTGTAWVAAAPGDDHTCAQRADGTLGCWGSNLWGQLARPTYEPVPVAVLV